MGPSNPSSQTGSSEGAVGILDEVGIDVQDLDRSSKFWSAVLGLNVARKRGNYLEFQRPASGLQIYLQKVPEKKTSKSRLHLDIKVKDLDTARVRVEAVGGRKLAEYREEGGRWFVMGDPDGNEFCLIL